MRRKPRYALYFRTSIYPIIRRFIIFFDFGAKVCATAVLADDDEVGAGNEVRFYGAEGVEGCAGEATGSDVSVGFKCFAEGEETAFRAGLFVSPMLWVKYVS